MTKESIIERLIDQGHIAISCAGRILTKSSEWLTDISDLHRDGNINTRESMRLLTEPSLPVEPNLVVKPSGEYYGKSHPATMGTIETPNATTQGSISSEPWASMGETCRNGKLWKDCTCC